MPGLTHQMRVTVRSSTFTENVSYQEEGGLVLYVALGNQQVQT